MFGTPTKTLQTSLHTLLDNALDFASDVYLDHPVARIHVHKAILITRIPEAFRHGYLKALADLQNKHHEPVGLQIDSAIPFALLQALVRFWYTAEFHARNVSPSAPASNASSLITSGQNAIRSEIEHLERQLGVAMLPLKNNPMTSDYDQLVLDLQRMFQEQIATDVLVHIVQTPKELRSTQQPQHDKSVASILFTRPAHDDLQPIPAHRAILATQSPYFNAIFCAQFQEATSSSVHLPGDLFCLTTVQVILGYFYTDTIIIPALPSTATLRTAAQRQISHKKHSLRVLHQVYPAADYLGQNDTIGRMALYTMQDVCHQFSCVCSECAVLLPSMLLFAYRHLNSVPSLYNKLMRLYSDPVHSIAPLWSQKPFAILVGSLSQDASSPLNQEDPSASNLVAELSDKTFAKITKNNAILVLHSLHLCLSQIRSADPFPTWSNPALNLLDPILHHTVAMVSDHFDFYCVEYPILLSCMDDMGTSFSVDFLDFLLAHVLEDGIRDDNAAILYQGIVRDLIGRQVVQNIALEGVLTAARRRCAAYLSRRWAQVKALDGFKALEKETLRQLSEDIGVPYRMLTKPIASDFSAIFSFNPKAAFKHKSAESKSTHPSDTSASTAVTPRRLSLSGLKSYHSIGTLKATDKSGSGSPDFSGNEHRTRTRSLSNEFLDTSRHGTLPENTDRPVGQGLMSQPLDHLLPLDDEENRMQHLDMPSSIPNSFSRQSNALTDALLPMDTVTSPLTPATNTSGPRPSRLKFELPTTPTRAKSPKPPTAAANKSRHKHGLSTRMPRWGLGSSSDHSDEEDPEGQTHPPIGTKVALLRRPLPTLGVIKYIGDVSFAKGTWVGVELESRLGKNDGAVDGIRYFQTDPQRGVFVKVDDFRVLDRPRNTGSHRSQTTS